ncbi:MAG TPA: TetR/AcrR family transcriptional regulator [Bacteroidales bacterium]|nr:TetR/AcrR family transcriptional regulator [Bacteroidales bacterium]
MSKLNKKYLQIIETGRDLFWKYGIKRVTIEEVCSKANVSKMTFYKHFSNKNHLVKQILDYIYDEGIRHYRSIMDSDKLYREKVADLVKLKIDATNDISHEFLNDYYSIMDNKLKGYLQNLMEKYTKIFLTDFIKAQKTGDIRADLKPEFIIYFINHMVILVNDPALNALYPDAQEMILELMNLLFYGIMPRTES